MVARFRELGAVAANSTPAAFAAYVRQDYDKWQRVIRDTGIKLAE
jgi:tripartite-type tricarboxylate transporter receptor subunit TctC